MELYHLGRAKFARQLSGEGARLHGGRWNLIGTPCLYTSAARSLCVLEFAANVPLDEMSDDLVFTVYEIPDGSWTEFSLKDLPLGWMENSSPGIVKEWGTKQLRQHLALKLPSVIIPSEFNFLLNPLHIDFRKVAIKAVESFTFDKRIKQ